MRSGFRDKQRKSMNKVGNINYSARDRAIGDRLNGNDVDEVWADAHVRKCLEEIQSTWSESETERRVVDKPSPVTVPQFIVHHASHDVPQWSKVE